MFVVLRPGFGPGSSARKAGILDRTILPELMLPLLRQAFKCYFLFLYIATESFLSECTYSNPASVNLPSPSVTGNFAAPFFCPSRLTTQFQHWNFNCVFILHAFAYPHPYVRRWSVHCRSYDAYCFRNYVLDKTICVDCCLIYGGFVGRVYTNKMF